MQVKCEKEFKKNSKILISSTQWYRTKLRKIVPNTNYLKPIILEFKTLIYDTNSKILYNLCIYRGNIPIGGNKSPGGEICYRRYFQKEHLKIRKNNR